MSYYKQTDQSAQAAINRPQKKKIHPSKKNMAKIVQLW
jgi:hypothetical protein